MKSSLVPVLLNFCLKHSELLVVFVVRLALGADEAPVSEINTYIIIFNKSSSIDTVHCMSDNVAVEQRHRVHTGFPIVQISHL